MPSNEVPTQSQAPKTVKIDLRNPVSISNLHNTWKFPAGRDIEVPTDLAEEVKRLDNVHQDYRDNLMVRRESTVDAGSFAVGSGE